jgi:hypothetical protein
MRSEVLAVVTVTVAVFWDMMPCNLVDPLPGILRYSLPPFSVFYPKHGDSKFLPDIIDSL